LVLHFKKYKRDAYFYPYSIEQVHFRIFTNVTHIASEPPGSYMKATLKFPKVELKR